MRCIIVEPREKPKVVDIPNDPDAWKVAVGGYIETVRISPDAVMIVNEESRLIAGYEPNRYIYKKNPVLYASTIYGPILIVGYSSTEIDFTDLTDEQVTTYTELFKDFRVFL